MHTDQIRYLSTINEKHSLSKASQVLHISPQALKLSLDALEREFNTKLVDRSRRGTYLNEKGHALLDLGTEFLKGIDALKAEYSHEEYRLLPHMKTTIYTVPGLANTLVARAVSELTVQFPNSDITFEMMPCTSLLENVGSRSFDGSLSITSVYRYENTIIPDLGKHNNVTFEPIAVSSYYCSVPRSLNISRYNSISMKTILKHPILIYGPTEDTALPLIKLFGEPKRIRSVQKFPIYFDLLQNDQESLSFAQLFQSQETLVTSENRALVPIKENIEVQIGFLRRANASVSPEVEELAQFVSNYIRKKYE